MKRVKKPVFFIIAALILALTYTSVFGVYTQNGDTKNTWIKGAGDIRWGIDIRGGVEATFSPADGVEATAEQLEAAKAIIELRMVSKSITDYEIYTDEANDKIIVRFPWKSGESDFDPEKAIEEISATALLTFREGNSYETQTVDGAGNPVYQTPTGTTAENIILEGSDVTEAKPVMQENSTSGNYDYAISLTLSDEGAKKFAEATERLKGKTISIWMDDIMISAPTVNAVITDGKASITGNFTAATASELAAKIQGGALPFALQTSNFSTVNPTLGMKSLDAMVMAGVIAFALIAVFMIIIFKIPGFAAVLTLVGQLAITFAAISGYFPFVNSFTMTLPGLAGIILSIGVGVDANIITASRIKEELGTGKTLDGAVFMIIIFKIPGFAAVLTLVGQLAITFAAISGYFPFVNSFTMTLPGLAGIILSIGVGVDANIITASRIKEELGTGKTLDGAIQKGCSNSLWSIIDGNITILIVAIMLIGVFGPSNILSKIFGESTTGAIYSFGYTLLVGVIGNFIMGVFCSRLMIKSLSGFKPLRKKWLFGGADK